MKNKKLLFLLTFVLIIILILLFFIIRKFNQTSESTNEENNLSEYTPEEEIKAEDLRKTLVSLFFLDEKNQELKNEGKLIDSAELLDNPYQKLVELLLQGPVSQDLKSVFPENTKLLNTTIDKTCVILNFSEELLNFTYDNQKYFIINSILNTLTELNEVDSIKILVNDNLPQDFEEKYVFLNNLNQK